MMAKCNRFIKGEFAQINMRFTALFNAKSVFFCQSVCGKMTKKVFSILCSLRIVERLSGEYNNHKAIGITTIISFIKTGGL